MDKGIVSCFLASNLKYDSVRNSPKCDSKTPCPDGPFKGQVCIDLSGRALIGSDEASPVLGRYEATFPDHHHPHNHNVHPHSHTYHSHGTKQSSEFMNSESKWLIRDQKDIQTTSVTVKIDPSAEGVDLDSLHTYIHPKASFGDLYSRHMRVEYIFKCF